MSTNTRIIKSNLWIGLSAASITAYFAIAFGAAYDLTLFWLILSAFLSTYAIYSFYRQQEKIWFWMIPAALAFLVSFTMNSLNLVIGINLILCLLYQTPFSKYPLRKNHWAKPLLIAACWLNTIWLAPLLQYAVPVWESMAASLAQKNNLITDSTDYFIQTQWKAAAANGVAIFCIYYALCLITDLNQVKEDQKNAFISFPIKYGLKTTFYSALLLLLPMLCFSFIHFPYSLFMIDKWEALTWVLSSLVVIIMVFKKPNLSSNAFWIDNIIGCCALSFLVLHFIKSL